MLDREYYRKLYGEISEAEFDRYRIRAAAKIAALTHGRAELFLEQYSGESATPCQRKVCEQIRQTVCELIRCLQTQDRTGMGSGISSVSNDGYSESYKVATAAEKEAQLESIVRRGLSGTGLAGAL
ncbi:MAG: hypothetical protein NC399_06425 [Muribaculum sp.]|nr:hypothetical protein [Muribaculum sp.]